jgi:hypothetical protein
MKKYSVLICLILATFMFISCALFQKVKTDPMTSATGAYKMAGEIIISSNETAKQLRISGKITDVQVVKYNELLAKTKAAYSLAGNSLKLYINATDAVEKKEYLLSFQGLATQAGDLANQIVAFLTEVNK